MFALVEIAGLQFEVHPNEIVKVPTLHGNPGELVEFSNILAYGNDSSTKIGAPYISGKVSAKILDHGKDAKVIVFKKKRRKGYRKLNGHRQHFTRVEITDIKI